jgi:hypothetical protein
MWASTWLAPKERHIPLPRWPEYAPDSILPKLALSLLELAGNMG